MVNTLLGSINKKAINEFRKDLLQMLRIGQGIDKYYVESNPDLDTSLKKFETLIRSFNKKYKGTKLKLVKKTDNTDLKMFLNEKNVKNCFENAASKIIGLQSIGTSNFDTTLISDAEAFADEIENVKNKLYLTYYNPQTGTTNVFLHYDGKGRKVELVYSIEEIENQPSPEFQLAAYYALSKGYNKKINLHDEGATLGFSFVPSHLEKAEYFRKFDPHTGE